MSKKKNPELKDGDRVILVYMPDESLDAGTKGVVKKIEKTPSFGGSSDYQYRVEWFDDNNKVISTLSLLPGVDSWLFDPEYTQKDLNEAKSRPITDLDTLISRHEWARLFRKSDLKYVMEYLELRFQGLLMTDDISMQALTGSLCARSAAAISAGCDVVLHCNGVQLEMAEVTAAAGVLSAAAQSRAAVALAARTAPQPVDIKALRAEFDAMLRGQGDG